MSKHPGEIQKKLKCCVFTNFFQFCKRGAKIFFATESKFFFALETLRNGDYRNIRKKFSRPFSPQKNGQKRSKIAILLKNGALITAVLKEIEAQTQYKIFIKSKVMGGL